MGAELRAASHPPGAEWHAEIDGHDPAAAAGATKRHPGDQATVGPALLPPSGHAITKTKPKGWRF